MKINKSTPPANEFIRECDKIPHEIYRAYVLEGREVKMRGRILA